MTITPFGCLLLPFQTLGRWGEGVACRRGVDSGPTARMETLVRIAIPRLLASKSVNSSSVRGVCMWSIPPPPPPPPPPPLHLGYNVHVLQADWLFVLLLISVIISISADCFRTASMETSVYLFTRSASLMQGTCMCVVIVIQCMYYMYSCQGINPE